MKLAEQGQWMQLLEHLKKTSSIQPHEAYLQAIKLLQQHHKSTECEQLFRHMAQQKVQGSPEVYLQMIKGQSRKDGANLLQYYRIWKKSGLEITQEQKEEAAHAMMMDSLKSAETPAQARQAVHEVRTGQVSAANGIGSGVWVHGS